MASRDERLEACKGCKSLPESNRVRKAVAAVPGSVCSSGSSLQQDGCIVKSVRALCDLPDKSVTAFTEN